MNSTKARCGAVIQLDIRERSEYRGAAAEDRLSFRETVAPHPKTSSSGWADTTTMLAIFHLRFSRLRGRGFLSKPASEPPEGNHDLSRHASCGAAPP